MNAIELYNPCAVCEDCGKQYTGLNDYEFVSLLAGEIDEPLCDKCATTQKKEKQP